jgi:CheY-like chemotaxis protein
MTAAGGCRDRPQGTVLIVEDEVLVRLDLADQLRLTGLSVLEASNADEALIVLEAIDGIALVVSDIRMPGAADGLDLVGWLRRERPAIKIVLVSGYNCGGRGCAPACNQRGSAGDLGILQQQQSSLVPALAHGDLRGPSATSLCRVHPNLPGTRSA